MVGLSRTFRARGRRLAFIAGLSLAAICAFSGAVYGVSYANPADTSSQECDDNALIYCGVATASDFIKATQSNNSGNGHNDLQAVYAYYGLEPAEYDKFVSYSRQGTAYADGRIVVDGQTVATGAKSIGRLAANQGSGYSTQVINGVKYYGNTNAKTFPSAMASLPVTVLFNNKGVMQFAVLNTCGNPEFGNAATPSYSCDALHKTPVAGKLNTYSFTTAASAANNATVAKVVYDFGDGTSKTVSGVGSPSVPVTHTYTKLGTFTAKVTVYVVLPGNQQVTVTSATCQTVIAVASFACLQLSGAFVDEGKMKVSLTARARASGGAVLTGADFDFGDGTSQENVQPSGMAVVVSHTYGTKGTYNTRAVLHFMANNASVATTACAALVTPTLPPTPECKPDVPVGSPDCLPPVSPSPPRLSVTGAGNTVAVFAAVIIAGFMVYRQLLFRKHRASFVAAERGTSPLPLGDPLSQDAPLANTPLASRKPSSSRRRRRP